MTERIVTRPFQFGNEKEGSWPPLRGTGGTGLFHFTEDGKAVEGPPPIKVPKFGKAPFVIQDTIDATYHHGACAWTDSRSAFNAMDRATGCVTTDRHEPASDAPIKARVRERNEDIKKAVHKAVAAIDNGEAPMTEETKHLCEVQNEIVTKALGWDAFNVAGRKDNAKGKKLKRR